MTNKTIDNMNDEEILEMFMTNDTSNNLQRILLTITNDYDHLYNALQVIANYNDTFDLGDEWEEAEAFIECVDIAKIALGEVNND